MCVKVQHAQETKIQKQEAQESALEIKNFKKKEDPVQVASQEALGKQATSSHESNLSLLINHQRGIAHVFTDISAFLMRPSVLLVKLDGLFSSTIPGNCTKDRICCFAVTRV